MPAGTGNTAAATASTCVLAGLVGEVGPKWPPARSARNFSERRVELTDLLASWPGQRVHVSSAPLFSFESLASQREISSRAVPEVVSVTSAATSGLSYNVSYRCQL